MKRKEPVDGSSPDRFDVTRRIDDLSAWSEGVSAAKRFSMALKAAKAGAWEWDVTSNQARWSEENYLLLGLEPGSGMATYDDWLRCVHPDDRERVQRKVSEALRQRSDLDFEYRAVWPDGSEHWIRDIGSLVLDEEGSPAGMYGIQMDVTETRALREGLHRAQQAESLGRIAGALAHDFNNLLQVILGFTGLLGSTVAADPSADSMLKEIERAAERAAHLTHQLLSVGRRQMLRTRVIDLNALSMTLDGLIHGVVGERVDFTARRHSTPLHVVADPTQLEHAILNLVVNAKDAMPTGGRLVLETSEVCVQGKPPRGAETLSAGRWATLSVEDSGHGMDAETRAHIFEPYFTTKPAHEGSGLGLGLASAYGIVSQSGGRIGVESEPGRGSRFTIYLRCTDKDIPEPELPDAGTDGRPNEGSETILVVDDESAIGQLVAATLGALGYDVLTAGSSEDALEKLGDRSPAVDLLITDVILPGLSGPELASRLKSRYPGLKILFMSGYSDEAIRRHGLHAEEASLLVKPFGASELTETVRRMLATALPR